MKVLVTGATGFVGSHSVGALLAAGHQVRMLVRSGERIAPALDPLGVKAPEHVIGDVTEPESVRRALDGCDAVLHAASVYTFDARAAVRMRRDNLRGTELVLGTARELELDPIVHVSSHAALLPSAGPLTPNSQIGEPKGAYSQSKAETERIARGLQDAAAPVTIVQPGMVWGPHDPHLGESASLARDIVCNRAPVSVAGGVPIVDVRDVAAVHAAVMEPRRGPRRYLATGQFLSLAGVLDALCGDRAAAARGAGACAARARRHGRRRRDAACAAVPSPARVPGNVDRRPRRPRRRHGHPRGAGRLVPAGRGGDRRHGPLAPPGRPHHGSPSGTRRGAMSPALIPPQRPRTPRRPTRRPAPTPGPDTEILALKGDFYRLKDRDLARPPAARTPETA